MIRARLCRCPRASRSSITASCCRSATPQDVYERPASRFVAEFLGEINLLPIENIGHCGSRHERFVRGRAPARGRVRSRSAVPRHAGHPPRAHVAGARGSRKTPMASPASIATTTYLGSAVRLGLATRGGTPLIVTAAARDRGEGAGRRPRALGHLARRQRLSPPGRGSRLASDNRNNRQETRR